MAEMPLFERLQGEDHDGEERVFRVSEVNRAVRFQLEDEWGSVLIEGVPGLGKTLLVNTLARTFGGTFKRVQFTPDLMPADILGTNMVIETDQGGRAFEFQKGPIFTQICLADEINRAPPRTQSALLEAMSDRQASVDGTTHTLPNPFMVIATQNPIDHEGTFPLPEAQLDRFLLSIHVGYPDEDDELEDDDDLFFPVIRAGADYRAPARYDERLSIETRLVDLESGSYVEDLDPQTFDAVHATVRIDDAFGVAAHAAGTVIVGRSLLTDILADRGIGHIEVLDRPFPHLWHRPDPS